MIVKLELENPKQLSNSVVWIYRAEEVSVATLLVRPRAFGVNESIGDLVFASRQVIRKRLLEPLALV